MGDEHNKQSSVGKTYEIDQRATKVFQDWLPDNWLARKQDPDFYIDYLVEIVENGEPTGKHFGVQIKGYEGASNDPKPLSYSFKTKHLDYYLNRSQHPVFLLLINVTTREGYWVFAQKYLKQKVSQHILGAQETSTVHFSPDDNLFNKTKFNCLLPEAETFVRDLHPGSIHAALQKRKAELESIDPRCAVSITVKDGREHFSIVPKEPFSFRTRIRNKSIAEWQNFFERGAEIKLERGEMEITGAPLLEEAYKKMGGCSKIQFGTQYPGSIQVFYGTGESPSVIQIDGKVSAGTKFMMIKGALPESPLEITGEIPFDNKLQNEGSIRFLFSLDKWTGQEIILLSHFDQIEALVRSLAASHTPQMQLLVRGNKLWAGNLSEFKTEKLRQVLRPIEWLKKCRWIAQYYSVNPALPCLPKVSNDTWNEIEDLYGLLKDKEICVPEPGQIITFEASLGPPAKEFYPSGTLTIEKEEQTVDYFGIPVRLGPLRHTFNDVRLVSRTPLEKGGAKFVLETTDSTKRTSILH